MEMFVWDDHICSISECHLSFLSPFRAKSSQTNREMSAIVKTNGNISLWCLGRLEDIFPTQIRLSQFAMCRLWFTKKRRFFHQVVVKNARLTEVSKPLKKLDPYKKLDSHCLAKQQETPAFPNPLRRKKTKTLSLNYWVVYNNRPFAAFHSCGTKPPCWDAKVVLGQDKQRILPFQIMYTSCWSCLSATFASQHGGFVPREWKAAKGIYRVLPEVASSPI